MRQSMILQLPFDFEICEIPVEVDYSIQNDGIGHYEFWGASYFDPGVDYPVVDRVTPVFTDEPQELRQRITDHISIHREVVLSQLEEKIEIPEPEPDYDPTEDGIDW